VELAGEDGGQDVLGTREAQGPQEGRNLLAEAAAADEHEALRLTGTQVLELPAIPWIITRSGPVSAWR
jgi:hypothetical protein